MRHTLLFVGVRIKRELHADKTRGELLEDVASAQVLNRGDPLVALVFAWRTKYELALILFFILLAPGPSANEDVVSVLLKVHGCDAVDCMKVDATEWDDATCSLARFVEPLYLGGSESHVALLNLLIRLLALLSESSLPNS